MSFLKKVANTAAIVATSTLIASAGQATPFTNGNFEQGLANWNYSGNVAFVTVPYFGAGTTAKDGNYIIAFNFGDRPANGWLSQTFDTVSGATYAVTFGYGMAGGGSQQLDVSALDMDGQSLGSMSAVSNHGGNLDSFTFQFTADSASTTLRFVDNTNNNSYWLDGTLDNVTVTNVPEPASLALLGLGLFGVAAGRRKKSL